jgi:hypothetical protein
LATTVLAAALCRDAIDKIEKGERSMEFLLSHWHCILPAIGIAVAMFFMRDKDKGKKDDTARDAIIAPRSNQD